MIQIPFAVMAIGGEPPGGNVPGPASREASAFCDVREWVEGSVKLAAPLASSGTSTSPGKESRET